MEQEMPRSVWTVRIEKLTALNRRHAPSNSSDERSRIQDEST
jgi:hypothetical protein